MKEVQFIMNFERINGYPIVKMVMSGKEVLFLLDTGCADCVLDYSFYNECGGSSEMILPAESICGSLGIIDSIGKTLCELTRGERKIKIPFVLADINGFLSSVSDDSDVQLVGILGSKFFRRHKIIIDYAVEMIYSYSAI
jgi:hypothetical protein